MQQTKIGRSLQRRTESMSRKKWFVTFGQRYRIEEHPFLPGAHPDGWVTIIADTMDEARQKAFEALGQHWSMIYDNIDPEWYPMGELARFE